MLSNRPYLLRAFYQWIVDSACTPIIVIDAKNPRSKVPQDFVEGGEIIFNISGNAVRDLKMTNDCVEFKASFSGVVHIISAPIGAILSVYAEENGEGIFFDGEEDEAEGSELPMLTPVNSVDSAPSPEAALTARDAVAKSRPVLKLVE